MTFLLRVSAKVGLWGFCQLTLNRRGGLPPITFRSSLEHNHQSPTTLTTEVIKVADSHEV